MKTSLFLLTFLALFATGCGARRYHAPFKPPTGLIVSTFTAPLTTNFNNTKVSYDKGETSSIYFRDAIFTGFDFAFEKCDIETAAAKGNLKNIEYADYEYVQIFGIFGKMTIKAYGTRE